MAKYLNEILEKAYNEIYLSEESFHNFSKLKEYLEYKEDVDSLLESNLLNNFGDSICKITNLGRKVYNGIGAEKHLEQNLKQKEMQALKENLEFEKTKINLELAKKMLEEFPKTKWFARIGFIIGIVLLLKELYIMIWK